MVRTEVRRICFRFVWHKKLEKQIASGIDMKELGLKAETKKQEQRLVRTVFGSIANPNSFRGCAGVFRTWMSSGEHERLR